MSTGAKRRQLLPIFILLISLVIGWSWDHWFRKVPVAVQRYQVLMDRRDPGSPASLQISLFALSDGRIELLDKADQCPVTITLLKPDGSYQKWYQKQWLTQLGSGPPASHPQKVIAGNIRSWTLLAGDLTRTLDGHDHSSAAAEIDDAVAIWVEPSLLGEEWIAPGVLNIDEPGSGVPVHARPATAAPQ